MPELIHRDILDQIKPWLHEQEILVLLGARQVGKTSVLRLLQQQLKNDQTAGAAVFEEIHDNL